MSIKIVIELPYTVDFDSFSDGRSTISGPEMDSAIKIHENRKEHMYFM